MVGGVSVPNERVQWERRVRVCCVSRAGHEWRITLQY